MSRRRSILMVGVPAGVLAGLAARMLLAGAGRSLIPMYDIIDLGTLGGLTSIAMAVNDVGQVVGGADIPGGNRHAYIWDPDTGQMTDLGTMPPYAQSEATDVNNAGEAVGYLTTTGDLGEAFIWRDGVMINLGNLGSPDVWAYGINDATQVVGSAGVGPDMHAFLWEDEVMTDLTETYGVGNGAHDINASGDVIVGSKLLHADGTVITLGTLGGEMPRT